MVELRLAENMILLQAQAGNPKASLLLAAIEFSYRCYSLAIDWAFKAFEGGVVEAYYLLNSYHMDQDWTDRYAIYLTANGLVRARRDL
jgi:hypothetical protein